MDERDLYEQKDEVKLEIIVSAGERQSFSGFGISQNPNTAYSQLATPAKENLNNLVWKDLKFKFLRLWLPMDNYATAQNETNMGEFENSYVKNSLIHDSKENGATALLLAPASLPNYMQQLGPSYIMDSEVENYTLLIAEFIKKLKEKYNIIIDATGISNEPATLCAKSYFTPSQMVKAVKCLKAQLHTLDLSNVKIIAPEIAEADELASIYLDTLKKDADAWSALDSFSTHSYNMAANDDIAAKLEGTGKDYWITEAGWVGAEMEGNAMIAASVASRYLIDMNHRVTHWIWFLGFEMFDEADNATRLISYKLGKSENDEITIYKKYYYLKQLTNTFDIGAIFRFTNSSLEGSMIWANGKKPRISAASAKNPDGTWGIGVCNFTSDAFSSSDEWNKVQGGYEAQDFRVTLNIEELENVSEKACVVYLSNDQLNCSNMGTEVIKNGRITVIIHPLELITIRTLD